MGQQIGPQRKHLTDCRKNVAETHCLSEITRGSLDEAWFIERPKAALACLVTALEEPAVRLSMDARENAVVRCQPTKPNHSSQHLPLSASFSFVMQRFHPLNQHCELSWEESPRSDLHGTNTGWMPHARVEVCFCTKLMFHRGKPLSLRSECSDVTLSHGSDLSSLSWRHFFAAPTPFLNTRCDERRHTTLLEGHTTRRH